MVTGWKPTLRWGQAGSLPYDGDRLEAYPTMVTGWKPTLRWGQAGSLPCDGDRLEAYPTVVVSRYLDCKICELTEDLSLAMDVIP
jgi:hypothetical protein